VIVGATSAVQVLQHQIIFYFVIGLLLEKIHGTTYKFSSSNELTGLFLAAVVSLLVKTCNCTISPNINNMTLTNSTDLFGIGYCECFLKCWKGVHNQL
jgi:hypothetical protein